MRHLVALQHRLIRANSAFVCSQISPRNPQAHCCLHALNGTSLIFFIITLLPIKCATPATSEHRISSHYAVDSSLVHHGSAEGVTGMTNVNLAPRPKPSLWT